jgi:DnaJ domain
MFERNKVDTQPDQTAVAIEANLDDGRVLKGKVAIPTHKSVYDVLNAANAFLDFEPFEGERQFIAKASLRSVKLLSVGRGPNLQARLRDMDGFDPHAILGVARTASWEEVKIAYHRLAKTYHPDRYSSAELPPEVADYLAAMARRVNAAFAALEAPQLVKKQAMATRAAPIYTSPVRP